MNELFIGTIKNHNWTFNHPDYWKMWLNNRDDGQYVLRPPTPFRDIRNINQNSLYWLRNMYLSDATGYTKEEIHEYVMFTAGYFKESSVFGVTLNIRISSTVLSTVEFSNLFKIQDNICSEYNHGLPDDKWLVLPSTE